MSPAERAVRRFGSAVRFFRKGLVDFDTTANVVPSSRFLVKAMVDPLERSSVRCVVELGTGTGSMTREILRRIGPQAHVHAVEIDASLLRSTVTRTRDARVSPHHGSAAHTEDLIGEACCGKVDAVVSSLGLAAMDRALRRRIQQSIQRVLAPGGLYTQYAYPHARAITVSFSRKEIYQFDAGAFLRETWSQVSEEFVPANIPPAFVYTCRGALPRARDRR